MWSQLELCLSEMPFTLSFLCLQNVYMQSEDCDDSSVVDSHGFVPDGVAGQSNNSHSGENSSLNSILKV